MFTKVKEWLMANRGKVLMIIGVIIGYLLQLQGFIEKIVPEPEVPKGDSLSLVIDSPKVKLADADSLEIVSFN